MVKRIKNELKMLNNSNLKEQTVQEKLFCLIFLILVAQMYSLGLWNVINLEINRLWTALYVVFTHYIGVLFLCAIMVSQAEKFRAYVCSYHRIVDHQTSSEKGSHSTKNLGKNYDARYRGRLVVPKKNDDQNCAPTKQIGMTKYIVAISLKILTATYFVHNAFLVWFLAQKKEIFPSDEASKVSTRSWQQYDWWVKLYVSKIWQIRIISFRQRCFLVCPLVHWSVG